MNLSEKNTTFCEECRNVVPYYVVEKRLTGTIKGKEYHYPGKEAYCQYYGSIVWVGKIWDTNLSHLYEVYYSEKEK